jgi:hypothetical protein
LILAIALFTGAIMKRAIGDRSTTCGASTGDTFG